MGQSVGAMGLHHEHVKGTKLVTSSCTFLLTLHPQILFVFGENRFIRMETKLIISHYYMNIRGLRVIDVYGDVKTTPNLFCHVALLCYQVHAVIELVRHAEQFHLFVLKADPTDLIHQAE